MVPLGQRGTHCVAPYTASLTDPNLGSMDIALLTILAHSLVLCSKFMVAQSPEYHL